MSVSCQKAPVTDESGWSLCTGNPIWRTFLTSLPILLDVQRGLATLQMPRRVDLPARDAASLDPRSQLVEVLRGWDLESRSLGNVLVAPELSGWARESSKAYRESGRQFNLRGIFADTSDGIHLSAVHGQTCMDTIRPQAVVRYLDGGPSDNHLAGGDRVSFVVYSSSYNRD